MSIIPSIAYPIPRSLNPVLWLDGADPAGNQVLPTTGTALATWVDKSGRGNSATQATGAMRPLFVANTQNSKPSVTFNGTQSMGLPMNILANGNSPYTVISVVNTTSSVAQRYFLQLNGGSGGTNNYLLHQCSSNQYVDAWFSNDLGSTATTPATTYAFGSIYSTTAGRTLYLGGTSVATAPSVARNAVNTSGNAIGTAFSLPFLGFISELLVYNTTLTAAQYQSVYAYLSAKWAV